MNVRLNKLSIENFKGIKTFQADFDGDHAVIKGANGTGKTTVLDAYSWLIDDKDSTGRVATGKGSFDITPLDSEGEALKGLVTKVIGGVSFDGTCHVLRKELHENVVKDQLRGYTTRCWIDEVPKTVTEFQAWIKERVPEDKYRLLSSLTYFFSKQFHWKKRRAVLCEFAGEIGTPQGFDELLAVLNGRTVDQYLKVLKEQKGLREEERDETNPRIDEVQRGLDEYAGTTDLELAGKRQAVQEEITQLDSQRQELFDKESERAKLIDKRNALKAEKTHRESELANDTSNIKHLLDAKKVIVEAVADRTQELANARNALALKDSEVRTKNSELQAEQRTLSGIQDEYKAARNAPTDGTCYACGQSLPEDKLAEVKSIWAAKLTGIEAAGNTAMERVNACKTTIEVLAHVCHNLQEKVGQAEIKLVEAEQYRDEKIPLTDAQIKQDPKTPPEEDVLWVRLDRDIKNVEAGIGEPMSEQLTAIDNSRTIKANELAALDRALAQADQAAKNKTRIEELEEKEKELAQAIADIEKQVADIERYNATVSGMVESAVNGRFKYVEFKLFNQLLNGSLEDCCEATLNGVPYLDMSCGQKIIVGIDIINVLSAHYGLSVPLFLDNAESLTFPIESTSQTIELCAQRDIKKMTVEKLQQREVVAA